jgi:hypothetical protein
MSDMVTNPPVFKVKTAKEILKDIDTALEIAKEQKTAIYSDYPIAVTKKQYDLLCRLEAENE